MKKVFIGLGVVIVLLVGGVYLVYSNLDSIVETAIEQAGTEAVGSEVAVDGVSLDLAAGRASIMGFSVANPAGYSAGDMVRFDELTVSVDITSLQEEVIRINSIVARNPYIRYESVGGTSNVDTVSARFASDEEAPVEDESAGEGPQLSIGSIVIEGIQGSLSDDRLPREMDVNLGDIVLEDLNGTPDEIASQVMKPLLSQITTTASQAILSSVGEFLEEDLQGRANEALDSAKESLNESLNESLDENLRENLGNLLNR